MKPLAWAGAFFALAVTTATAEPLTLVVTPIENFGAGETADRLPLQFIGGLELASKDKRFGGLSGISISGTGDDVFIVSDTGSFITARLVHDGGRLVGIADATIDSLFPDGDVSKKVGDAEDVAFDPHNPQSGVIVRERQANALLGFDLKENRPTGFRSMRVGAPDDILRSNSGLESVDFAPRTSPAAGRLVAIAEQPGSGEQAIPGWIVGSGEFAIVQHDNFGVSSARFLPDGDLITLERRYTPPFGVGMRLRRFDGAALKAGALLDGGYLIDAGGITSSIDNMEGLAAHVDATGRTILTLVSDDNHSFLQRTLILQFAIPDD